MANSSNLLHRGIIGLALLIGLAGNPAGALAGDKPASDMTTKALNSCLTEPANASTAGQTQCEIAAKSSFDRRMNAAYAALQRILPVNARQQLLQSQRAWIAFRNLDKAAQSDMFATRQGTMYVPMQASAETRITRDRALQLENYRQIMSIEP